MNEFKDFLREIKDILHKPFDLKYESPRVLIERHDRSMVRDPMQQAEIVFTGGDAGGPQFSRHITYVENMPPDRSLFTVEKTGESLLFIMHKRVSGVTERQDAADAFQSMVMDMPKLTPTRFIEAVYGLALNNWNYSPEFADVIKQDGKEIMTPEQWTIVKKANPDIIYDMFPGTELASAEARKIVKDDTARIKQDFQEALTNAASKTIQSGDLHQ